MQTKILWKINVRWGLSCRLPRMAEPVAGRVLSLSLSLSLSLCLDTFYQLVQIRVSYIVNDRLWFVCWESLNSIFDWSSENIFWPFIILLRLTWKWVHVAGWIFVAFAIRVVVAEVNTSVCFVERNYKLHVLGTVSKSLTKHWDKWKWSENQNNRILRKVLV